MRIVRGCLQEHSSATTISHQWQRCWCGGLFLRPPASDLSIAQYRHELVIFTTFGHPINQHLAGKPPLAADPRGGNLTLPGHDLDRLRRDAEGPGGSSDIENFLIHLGNTLLS